jgi:hypothetical protein
VDIVRAMRELLLAALPVLIPALLPVFLVLIAPVCGKRARTWFGAGLLFVAAAFVVDTVIYDHSAVRELDVPNVLPRGPEGEGHVWIVDRVTAPASRYHYVIAAGLAAFGLWIFLRRGRAPAAPQPAVMGTLLFIAYLLLRVALEKAAAPEGVIWAAGVTFAGLLVLPFFGWYAGRRGSTWKGFVGQLLLMAFSSRLVLVTLAFFATTRRLGSHLDTHLVTDIHLWPFGEVEFHGDDVKAWLYTTAFPQLTFAVVFGVVAGIVLGTLPFWIARRRGGHPAE